MKYKTWCMCFSYRIWSTASKNGSDRVHHQYGYQNNFDFHFRFEGSLFVMILHAKNCGNQIDMRSRIILVVIYYINKTSITSVCMKKFH